MVYVTSFTFPAVVVSSMLTLAVSNVYVTRFTFPAVVVSSMLTLAMSLYGCFLTLKSTGVSIFMTMLL